MSSVQDITPSGYGLGPMERWYNEDVNDGGALPLQLEQQLGAECTCLAAGRTMSEYAKNLTVMQDVVVAND